MAVRNIMSPDAFAKVSAKEGLSHRICAKAKPLKCQMQIGSRETQEFRIPGILHRSRRIPAPPSNPTSAWDFWMALRHFSVPLSRAGPGGRTGSMSGCRPVPGATRLAPAASCAFKSPISGRCNAVPPIYDLRKWLALGDEKSRDHFTKQRPMRNLMSQYVPLPGLTPFSGKSAGIGARGPKIPPRG
jgi:hypothetical protein